MKFITVSDLSHKATLIVSEMESTGEEVVITKKGRPLILMSLVSNSDFALKEKGGKETKDSEMLQPAVELAKKLKNDPEVGKTARTVLSVYRSLVGSEKKEEATGKKYKKLTKKKGD